jgi:hypothetical protein
MDRRDFVKSSGRVNPGRSRLCAPILIASRFPSRDVSPN